ncbi:MAG: acetyl-CoA carboxylase, biotin carboxyl carrier protein [Candidatus Reconcilbacillus cellulovorans]|uniref:Biotin carboxyl carrier protein of acetyl-CoA carboxylase n=1 Tax=Candidatus Reconcilbacillus cellulovorans TaxID=1906605 RepID=A0A2A6E0L6_9BACL|nr:MAG: acetyl-CoA carboxylase, biotin carboxyl carrier protein [Candidatus Reconcilbacillus cellulovorans]
MFRLEDIKELVRLVDQSSVSELEIEHEGSRLAIRKSVQPAAPVPAVAVPAPVIQQPVAVPTASAPAERPEPSGGLGQERAIVSGQAEKLHTIVAPMVGTFYRSPAPGAPPFVEVGDKVNEKTVVCIIEAMKLMNEIEAEVRGEIVEILAENGQLVEYGEPLFRVRLE